MECPQLWVFAGPNGAGKSTLADRHVRGRMPIVNPDNIARELPRAASGGLDEREAGKRAIIERARRLADGETFAFETTLSGNSELKLMRDASAAGYKVNLVYVGIPSADASALRVSERVAAGGHDVAREDTDRRYARTMGNLPLAMAIADRTFVFDNTGRTHRLVLIREADRTRFEAAAFPAWAARALPADLRLEGERGPLSGGLLAMAREALRDGATRLLDTPTQSRSGDTPDEDTTGRPAPPRTRGGGRGR